MDLCTGVALGASRFLALDEALSRLRELMPPPPPAASARVAARARTGSASSRHGAGARARGGSGAGIGETLAATLAAEIRHAARGNGGARGYYLEADGDPYSAPPASKRQRTGSNRPHAHAHGYGYSGAATPPRAVYGELKPEADPLGSPLGPSDSAAAAAALGALGHAAASAPPRWPRAVAREDAHEALEALGDEAQALEQDGGYGDDDDPMIGATPHGAAGGRLFNLPQPQPLERPAAAHGRRGTRAAAAAGVAMLTAAELAASGGGSGGGGEGRRRRRTSPSVSDADPDYVTSEEEPDEPIESGSDYSADERHGKNNRASRAARAAAREAAAATAAATGGGGGGVHLGVEPVSGCARVVVEGPEVRGKGPKPGSSRHVASLLSELPQAHRRRP